VHRRFVDFSIFRVQDYTNVSSVLLQVGGKAPQPTFFAMASQVSSANAANCVCAYKHGACVRVV
jgi:hypothetical protein